VIGQDAAGFDSHVLPFIANFPDLSGLVPCSQLATRVRSTMYFNKTTSKSHLDPYDAILERSAAGHSTNYNPDILSFNVRQLYGREWTVEMGFEPKQDSLIVQNETVTTSHNNSSAYDTIR